MVEKDSAHITGGEYAHMDCLSGRADAESVDVKITIGLENRDEHDHSSGADSDNRPGRVFPERRVIMGVKTNIAWCDHTFQSVDRLH